ncbi:MAG: hypothetical protein FJW56_08330 [Actinobacteria bacterium]|nr:hypothetical protein [Actinomycetota bacterium]
MKISAGLIFLLSLIAFSCEVDEITNIPSSKQINYSPTINRITVRDTIIVGRQSTKVTCFAFDLDYDNLKYQWISKAGKFEGSGAIVNWVAPSTMGIYFLKCRVSDNKNGTTIDSVRIFVNQAANLPPMVRGFYATKDTISVGETTTLICDAYDLDYNIIRYTWYLNSPGELVSVIGNVGIYKGTVKGTHTITCLVGDNVGSVTSTKIIIVK